MKRTCILTGLLVSLVSLMAVPVSADTTNRIYFNPSSADVNECSENIHVKLMTKISDANPVVATLIAFSFDNTCLKITEAIGNTEDWKGGITIQDLDTVNQDGEMTFSSTVGLTAGITGDIEIATLTLKCLKCQGCLSLLDLTKGEYTTIAMNTMVPELQDGTFTCASPPELTSPEQSPPSPEPPSPSAPQPAEKGPAEVKLEGLDNTSGLVLDRDGRVEDTRELWSPDQRVRLDIAKGTRLFDSQGNTLDSLSVSKATAPSVPPSLRIAIIGSYDFRPDGATFEPAITLTVRYDPGLLSEGIMASELYIAYWDGKRWVALESNTDTGAKTVRAEISHFTQFIVVAEKESPSMPAPSLAELPAPAIFNLSDLQITPDEVKPAEPVTVSALVTNIGGSEGVYNTVLKINGTEEAREELTIAAGQSEKIVFTTEKDAEGTYDVDVNRETGQFKVINPAPLLPPAPVSKKALDFAPEAGWWFIGGIITGGIICIVIIVLLLISIRRRR